MAGVRRQDINLDRIFLYYTSQFSVLSFQFSLKYSPFFSDNPASDLIDRIEASL